MEVTNVKVRKMFNDDKPLKAIISVTFDECLAVHDVKIIEVKDKTKTFVVMPATKLEDGTYRDIVHPINSTFREKIVEAVLEEYEKQRAVIEAAE